MAKNKLDEWEKINNLIKANEDYRRVFQIMGKANLVKKVDQELKELKALKNLKRAHLRVIK